MHVPSWPGCTWSTRPQDEGTSFYWLPFREGNGLPTLGSVVPAYALRFHSSSITQRRKMDKRFVSSRQDHMASCYKLRKTANGKTSTALTWATSFPVTLPMGIILLRPIPARSLRLLVWRRSLILTAASRCSTVHLSI